MVECQWHRSEIKQSVTWQDSLCCYVPAYMASTAPSRAHFGAPNVVGSAIAPSLPLLLHCILSLPQSCPLCAGSAAKQLPRAGLLSAPAVPASPLQHPINSLFLNVITLLQSSAFFQEEVVLWVVPLFVFRATGLACAGYQTGRAEESTPWPFWGGSSGSVRAPAAECPRPAENRQVSHHLAQMLQLWPPSACRFVCFLPKCVWAGVWTSREVWFQVFCLWIVSGMVAIKEGMYPCWIVCVLLQAVSSPAHQ